jgi:type I restriction enzyme R subunit
VQRLQARNDSAYSYCFAPFYRNLIIELYRKNSIWVDTSPDHIIDVGFSKATAEKLTHDFRSWIESNRDRIHALRLLFAVGEKQTPLLLADLEDLLSEMKKADARYTVDSLWRNYSILAPEQCQKLDKKGTVIADVIQLVKYAMKVESHLQRFNGIARQRFELWLGRKKKAGIEFSEEQRKLLNKIAELIAEYLTYELADIREHDGALVAQCKKAGLSGYEKELYNALVA